MSLLKTETLKKRKYTNKTKIANSHKIQIMHRDEKKWQILPEITPELILGYPEYSKLVLQLLFNRNILDKDKIKEFLEGSFEKGLHDPFLFSSMDDAVSLIIKHIKNGNKITIYGDYDADGVTSSAILVELLRIFKADVGVYIPHRINEGYGVNKSAIDFIIENGTKLIITVDNGIRSKAEVEYAKEKGMDVIVTDHHVPPNELSDYPDCLIINPSMPAEKYPDKNLSGAGVAFKLASALVVRSTLDEKQKQALIRQMLDIAAIGTVADCVSLVGENRIIVKEGLSALDKTKRLGLLELFKVAKINLEKNMDSWNIGFQIAPRLNAAGRMDHANTSYQLLVTKNEIEAKWLAEELNGSNQRRQANTEEIFEEVLLQVDPEKDVMLVGIYNFKNNKAKEEAVWNEGVIGLVAGRISNKHYRPCLVITETDEGYKGSGRSIPGFNLIKAIEKCSNLLEKYGGHPAACGFSLKNKNIGKFIERIKSITKTELASENLQPLIRIESVLRLKEADSDLLAEVKRFEPFGQANDKPIFASYKVQIIDIMPMGFDGQHVKLKLKQDDSGLINALGFGQADRWKDLRIHHNIDIAYHLELNTFNGRTETQLKIIDIKINDVRKS
ncbi:MAG: Single-stranded-DNA-specific exonuclease RecJ [Candidatus Falkowbacteria bacterium GW2011_GWC2_38_22]|uniref:Single-stranded-DNA-specific exonuclease RecJ n=1 Tax=Candidatus Falkowbacteria bacterium GW2011_GWE1_38_31 TaxID=1618638 RepID=A0A0G0MB63_9BACT|nr:MAG: Single-stranded-DNA-specific exonuclease RecJ [Candidatus Falkowbacteria bacterium GW2011_GWF2_38_1205]KKQ62144.1 MAG: Single-stranded-DNA-specific exonuclease RecJ [Candidatus Falkowbacteria bacterium GW2011_GWC2_38_22]KKQ64294.1 MAG: Single-stranded-DNA-specific exonuclease RecJ [Candidatus Falkowbacteria bacterium GW2011_GWF1_38_22]KKQ66271.1 MAG: Single-stranded-DNA-specific exonuclease RecJ [Candidatus Falkowbacteria bacterium GW2011_GWE2_38_254]KKQ70999.1 MAG: Single-stranded-DNA-